MSRTRVRTRVLLAGILVATTIAYLPAIRAPFELDDYASIPQNVTIRTLSPELLRPPVNTSLAGRPIVNVTFGLDDAIDGWARGDRGGAAAPASTLTYHVTNLVIHLASGCLLFVLVGGIARRAGWAEQPDGIALLVVALWLLHPIQTEAVNYLVQRTELLASFFYLATLCAWIRSWGAANERTRNGWRVLSIVTCALGMGSKEIMVTAPLAVMLIDRAFWCRSWRETFSDRGRSLAYAALLATAAWPVAMAFGDARHGTAGFRSGLPWYRYLLSQGWAVPHYLLLTLWPHGLTFDYGMKPYDGALAWCGLVGLAAIAIVSVIAWTRAGRWRAPAIAGIFFLLLLAPSSSFIPIATEIAAERRMYLALAPVLMLVVIGLSWLTRPQRTKGGQQRESTAAKGGQPRESTVAKASRPREWTVATTGLIVVIVGLFGATFARSRTYADPEALWRGAVERAPTNPRALDNLATEVVSRSPDRWLEAAGLYEQAINLDSSYVYAWAGLASVYSDHGRLPEAKTLLDHVLAIEPDDFDAVELMGRTLVRMREPAQATPYLERFATAYPTDNSLALLGVALLQTGKVDSAESTLRAALRINPDQPDALHNLGALLTAEGRGAEAVPLFTRLFAAGRASPIGVGLLSLAYAQAGNVDQSAEAARAAVDAAGRNPAVLVLAGRAMLLSRRYAEAETYLRAALQLNPADADARRYLSLVEAQSGRRAR